MMRGLRVLLIAALSGAALLAIALALAWAFLPREWISREAQRRAAAVSGADVRWKRLEPGFDGLSIGVRIDGLSVRMPAEGEAALDARAEEVFVRFKLFPLLLRRVEISAARVRNAGVALWDRGTAPAPAGGGSAPAPAAGVALALPRLELDGLDVRTRDRFGGGIDVRRIRGVTEIVGTLDRPRTVRLQATAESLYWKGSARDPLLALPSPLRIEIALASASAGSRLDVKRGDVSLGPLRSTLGGTISLPPAPASPLLDLTLTGEPQEIQSTSPAFRAFAAATPVPWSTNASWEIRIGGTVAAPVQSGTLTLKPVDVASGENKFRLDDLRAVWSTSPDRTFTASAQGGGSGVTMRFEARGSMEPGGAMSGTAELGAPAERLNGLVPNTPTWKAGALAVRALFAVRGTEPPNVAWTVTGRDLAGSAPGVNPPIHKLAFQLAGDSQNVTVRSFDATVGSSTASITGTMKLGQPLGTGSFVIHVDRVVAEEWTPPSPPKQAAAKKEPGATGAAPPPLPFRRLMADISIDELRQGGMTVRDVRVPVRYEEGTLDASPIHGSVGAGSIGGALTVRNLIANPSYSMKLDIEKAPVQEVARGLIPFDPGVTGTLNGGVELSGPGLPGPEVSDSLRGSLQGTIEDGKIANTESLRQIRSLLGLGPQADVAFKSVTHMLRIERGRLLLDKVRGDLGADKFEITGAMGLDRSLDLRVLLRLAPERVKGGGALAELARYARDADGRIPVELSIGGTTAAPRVQLKSGKLLDVAGKGLKESLTKALMSRLAPPTPAADTTRAAEDSTAARGDSSTKKDPLEKGRDALRRLLGK